MEMIEVDGLRIAYDRAGAGPPLVLLHGYVGDGPTTWRRRLEGLCDQFTVVAWDAPGPVAHPTRRNRSAWAATPTAWPDSKRLGLDKPHVAGCRSAARLPWSCAAATRLSRGRWS
jgi:pimeloyl-ACP methyl ester carboxylesterase